MARATLERMPFRCPPLERARASNRSAEFSATADRRKIQEGERVKRNFTHRRIAVRQNAANDPFEMSAVAWR
jgi:hypothetical protein